MTKPDPLDELLRGSAPATLADDGFVARTMAAVDVAARAAVARRPAPPAPLAIARALAAERQRHEAQIRSWRWAKAGVGAGGLLLLAAMMLSPGGETLSLATPPQWVPLCVLLMVGAVAIFWSELREG